MRFKQAWRVLPAVTALASSPDETANATSGGRYERHQQERPASLDGAPAVNCYHTDRTDQPSGDPSCICEGDGAPDPQWQSPTALAHSRT